MSANQQHISTAITRRDKSLDFATLVIRNVHRVYRRWKPCLNAYPYNLRTICVNRTHDTSTSIADGSENPVETAEMHDALASRRHDIIAWRDCENYRIRHGTAACGGWHDDKQRWNTNGELGITGARMALRWATNPFCEWLQIWNFFFFFTISVIFLWVATKFPVFFVRFTSIYSIFMICEP